jgi:23S rRNA (uracil1939-C5)-methyltransferase
VLGYKDETWENNLIEFINTSFPAITTFLITINTKWNDSMYDLSPTIVTGKGFITEKLDKWLFKISAKSFFQTNTFQAESLYTIVKKFARLTGNEILYDLYCGTGSIGIFVSDMCKKIIGVETISEAVEDAKENALLNNINNAQFFDGDVIKICTDSFFETHGKPDVIITDPPRAGMHQKLIDKLLEIQAPIMVYVSCNPATQARDLNQLCEKYTVKQVQPVDMFPHTHHIECVAQLILKPLQ